MRISAVFLAVSCLFSTVFARTTVRFDFGSRIVFCSDMDGNDDLYLLSRGRLTRLTDDPASDQWPVPDPKGERIVFTSNRAGSFDIYLMNLASRETRRLTSDPRDELSPSWSADGRFVYYDLASGRSGVRTMKLDLGTGVASELYPDPPFSSTIVTFPNPEGTELYFTGKVFLGWLVAKYEPGRGKYTELTKKGSCRPKVSPDGKKIAYVGHDDDGLGDIFVMNPDGSAKENMTRGRPDSHDYYPCFSPDGGTIVFSSSPKTKGKSAYQLHTLNLGTGEVRRILESGGNDRFPYWFK
jgi:Tol biopolymer transport system component